MNDEHSSEPYSCTESEKRKSMNANIELFEKLQYEYTVRHKVDALTHISDEGRARLTISPGKLSRSVIPEDLRMGEPNTANLYYPLSGRTPSELKYLSNWGKEIKRDSVSSDERKRKSLNSWCVKR